MDMSNVSPSRVPEPRKRRTRQHVIADLSVHYVEGFILEAGHTAERVNSDYGYDLVMRTFDEQGYVEPGAIFFQLKAMETLKASASDFVYDIDIRDYNLWIREKAPVVFILFDASGRRAYWQAVQQYFRANAARRPRKGARRVRIRIPRREAVNGSAIARMRALQQPAIQLEEGEEP
jgi:hypothetical protein